MTLVSIRSVFVLTAILAASIAWWLTVHVASGENHAQVYGHAEPAIVNSAANEEANAVAHDAQALVVPKVRVLGTMLSQQGEPSALLAIGRQPATWYRRGDEPFPGFVITEINADQVTLLDNLHKAYYEFALQNDMD